MFLFAPVSVGCFLLFPASLGLVCVLLFLHRWSALEGWFPTWRVPFEVSCYCLCCYTYSHHCVSLLHTGVVVF